uniref:Cation-transporting P-type ATPase C-terminal domain-containing protein n=1 Tax=Fibrocapsa japonica TaxID=94617 RepID=A0A7S2UYB5_9STRA|mmetsp:Transcript_20244/g.29270  ORF Transcript_20244/g.29270 Transcript_20244/m.29270 type:complete len:562 (+) Transcript_20244:1-1686(+)
MSVIIQRPDSSFRLYTKGASEIVLADCTHRISATGQVLPLHASDLKLLELKIHEMAKRALRTVVVAHRDLPDFQNGELMDLEPRDVEVQLVLDAVVGIQDPLRPDVPEAVKTCQEAGVQVRMVTGDNLETACAIARDCGILVKSRGDVALEGPTFRNLTPAALDNILPKLQVIARASPHDKFLLVTRLNGQNLPKNKEEWEKMHPGANWKKDRDRLLPGYFEEWMKATKGVGQVVGVTGDGTNDAPALKAADVGLSMGLCGTEVAREASDIVLLDDKFSSIVKAVLWGRTVFDNIRKFLQFQLTVNLVALILSLIGACIGFNEPILNAVMMLWVNLIMDTMGALALGTELPSRALLCRRPYKRNANLVNRVMWRNILVQAGYQLGLLCYLLLQGHEAFGVEKGSVKHFTIIFNAFVFCQVFNEINARSIGNSMNVFKGLFSNIIFLGIIAFTVGAQYGIIQYGGDFTRTCPLTNMEWAETVLMGGLTLPLGVVMRILPPFEEGAKNFAGLGEGVHSSAVVKQDAEPSFLALLVMMVGPVLAYAVFQIFKEHGTLDIILPVM